MTSKADFYVLPSADPESRGRFLCRLAEKIRNLGHEIYIHTPNQSTAEHIDQLLWEFRPESFIPHSLIGETPEAPIQIGWGEQRSKHRDVFINLDLEISEDALSYDRILEIVVQSEHVLTATRSNYKRYQDAGIPIDMHDMRKR